MIISTFALLPNALTTYYYPKFTYQFGKTNNPIKMWQGLLKIYLLTFLALIPMIAILYFLMDEVIQFFPKYTASLPYMKLALLIGPFVLYKLGNLVNVVLKKVNYMGLYAFLYAFFQIASIFVLHQFISNDILYIAIWSQIITSLCLFVSSLIINYRVVHIKIKS
jgi:hypothetical protein